SGPELSSAGGMLVDAIARCHVSAVQRANAHAEYSRSTPCFQAHSTWRPSLAARKRRNDSVRRASALPSALRAGSIEWYTARAATAGTAMPKMIAPIGPLKEPRRAVTNDPAMRDR